MTSAPVLRRIDRTLKDLVPPSVRVAKRALQSWRHGEPELHLLPRLCSRHLWSVDVGANNGVYAWHLARWSAGVTAFEPQPVHAAFLARAFGSRVSVEQVALSDAPGEALLRVPVDRDEDGRATIEPRNALARHAVRKYAVRRRCLDSYTFPKIGLIKIDVEGHEIAVLKGSQAILERDRPNLIIEAEDRHYAGTLEIVCGFLSRFGYAPHVCRGDTLVSLEISAPSGGAGENNYVFLVPGAAAASGLTV